MMTAGGANGHGFTRRTGDIPNHLYPRIPREGKEMTQRVRVAVTLLFDVDPEKWAKAYGQTLVPMDADDLRMYFDGVSVTDMVPAAREWIADDEPGPEVRVAAHMVTLNRQ